MEERRGVYMILEGKPEENRRRRRWEENTVLKWTFRKWDGREAWTGLMWLKTGTGGGHVWVR